MLERVHQYVRCIEGLILPAIAKTKQHFKSRTELFIGPRHHDFMGALFDMRSAVEHLHEDRVLFPFEREKRLEVLRNEAVAEYIARSALVRILDSNTLAAHFGTRETLGAFWAMPDTERKALWGEPIDPMDALADFEPQYIHDGSLGRPEG